MIFSNSSNQWKVKNTKEVKLKCNHCGNTCDHYVLGCLTGPAFGFVLQPASTKLGFKKYYLTCSICNQINKEISKEELNHLKIK